MSIPQEMPSDKPEEEQDFPDTIPTLRRFDDIVLPQRLVFVASPLNAVGNGFGIGISQPHFVPII